MVADEAHSIEVLKTADYKHPEPQTCRTEGRELSFLRIPRLPEVSSSFCRGSVTKHIFHMTFSSGKPGEDASGFHMVLAASQMCRKW